MARFPYYRRNIVALGRLLAEARVDPEKRAALKNAPQQILSDLGLPEHVTKLISFEVVDGASSDVVALPYRLNEKRVSQGNREYLSGLGAMFQAQVLKTGPVAEEKSLN
ncbi:hypothetical protein [Roseibium sp.]|uniref:hypothetical protein n=1 Tax=Roseibium sp. TaxID=1936156 RepID=UPI003BAEC0E1